MKIVIDARLYSQSGVGRYLQQLIKNLAVLDQKNCYLIYLNRQDYFDFRLPAKNFEKKMVDVPWHSFREQYLLPIYLVKDRPNLVHFPYFSLPILYPGKFLVTIHDLTIDHLPTGRASTHFFPLYHFKRWVYKLILKISLRKAFRIIAVSQTTKKEIVDHYQVNPCKIVVAHEAAEIKFSPRLGEKPLFTFPYLLYVGNAYPHKNLPGLFKAFNLLNRHFKRLKLILVGKNDFFYQRLKKEIPRGLRERVVFFGRASDKQLANLYHYAQSLVFPSLMEGFGLPPLEAMSLGCPVVCSDIQALKEICQKAALYFDPKNPQDMAQKIKSVLENSDLRRRIKLAGIKQAKKYSWEKMARETLAIYQLV